MTEDPEHAESTEAAVGAGWHRLHPLSPLIRAGGLVSGLLGILVLSVVTADSYKDYLYQVVVAAGLVVTGFIRWLVTRWKLDGTTLRIETGLLRRDSRQLPMTRIQAVDVVRPLLARMLAGTDQAPETGARQGTAELPLPRRRP